VQWPLDSSHQPEESHSIRCPCKRRYTKHTIGHLVISFGTTKPPAHPEYGDRVSSWNVGKPSHLNAAICLRKFHCIHITVIGLQSCQPVTNYNLIMFNLHITKLVEINAECMHYIPCTNCVTMVVMNYLQLNPWTSNSITNSYHRSNIKKYQQYAYTRLTIFWEVKKCS